MAWKTVVPLTLLVGSALTAPGRRCSNSTSTVNTTTCNGNTFVYQSFVGYGFTPSNARDKFGDTAGGIGSSAAIDPTSWKVNRDGSYTGALWALPDRGWNTDGTLNFQPRVHKFSITFTPNDSATLSDPAPPNLHLSYQDSIRFTDPSGAPVTGLDPDFTGPYLSFPGFPSLPSATFPGDGFGGEGPGGRRVSLDSEGLVLNKDSSFWISDEYGAYIYLFSPTGQMLSAIRPPDAVIPRRNGTESFSAGSPPRYDPDRKVIPRDPDTGRSNNQGLEGLTASPDGKMLYALMQSALMQEGGAKASTRRFARLLQYDVSNPSKPVYQAEYVVPLPFSDGTRVAAQSEIKFISPTQFLVLARDSGAGAGQSDTQSLYRHADVFDISAATNIKGPQYDSANSSIASTAGELKSGITPATYCSWLDYNVNSELGKFGLHNGGAQDSDLLNEKWESFALMPAHPDSDYRGGCGKNRDRCDEYFLFSWSDNDFITTNGFLNDGQFQYSDKSGFNLLNQVLVFRVKLPQGSDPRVGK
jgi:hypothetical protein